MLSYRHAFHAGNYADLLKHCVLVEMLMHLCKKEARFEYIDTHAGAGVYDLSGEHAQKLQEFSAGVGKLNPQDYPELETYFHVLDAFNGEGKTTTYPGSPAIAKHLLRAHDKGWLFELHPSDFELLQQHFSRTKNMRVQNSNGYDGLNALLPPRSRRGLILIDPSYEVKSEYETAVESIIKAHKKFNQGMYALWYPVVDRTQIDRMASALKRSGIKDIQQFELGVANDSAERGMTSSGMFVINPPWTLFQKMSALLPRLAEQISQIEQPIYQCEILVGE